MSDDMFRVMRGCIGLGAICFALMAKEQDFEDAKYAAKQGCVNVNAQNYVGVMCATGQDILQGDAEKVEWLRKTAKQGNAQAQFNLGWMYVDSGAANQIVRQYAHPDRRS